MVTIIEGYSFGIAGGSGGSDARDFDSIPSGTPAERKTRVATGLNLVPAPQFVFLVAGLLEVIDTIGTMLSN